MLKIDVKWEDDHGGLSSGFVGDTQVMAPEGGTFIDIENRIFYIGGRKQDIDVPYFTPFEYHGNIWVPSNLGYDEPEHLIQDFKRFISYQKYEWCYTGCVVTVSLVVKHILHDGCTKESTVQLGQNSLWGIESDCGEEYKKEVEGDVTREAKIEALDTINAIRNLPEDKLREYFLGIRTEKNDE